MAELGADQASGLRRLFRHSALRVVTFASGGKGAGKTSTVVNVAAAIARQGKEVLIVDENAGSGVAAAFGVKAKLDLVHVLNREHPLSEVLLHVAPGIQVLPAARAVGRLGKLAGPQRDALVDALAHMDHAIDVILVDTSLDHPLGFSPFGLAAQETVIVAAAGGTAITEAYALIKKVSLGYSRRQFRILVNKVRDAAEAEAIHANLAQVAAERGVARLDYAGHLPLDAALRHASRIALPVVSASPEAPVAAAFRALAAAMLRWPSSEAEAGGLEQFVQQLLHLSQRIDPVTIRVG